MNPARAFVAALAVVAMGLLGACTSQPGAKTVTQDYIEGMFTAGEITEVERDCMIGKLDGYGADQVGELSEANMDVVFSGATAVPEGVTPEMQAFIDDLGECFESG